MSPRMSSFFISSGMITSFKRKETSVNTLMERETAREREKERERQKESERKRERERKRAREREREWVCFLDEVDLEGCCVCDCVSDCVCVCV